MAKKSILIVISSLNRGGTEGHVLQVFSKINREKYTIVVYTTSHKGVLAGALESQGVNVIEPPCAAVLRKFGRLGRYLLYGISSLKLSFLMLRLRPAIVHCFLPGAYLMGGICAIVTRCTKLVMSRRSLNYYQTKHVFLSRIERWLYKKTDLIIGNSKAVNRQLLEEGVSEDKLVLLYNGVDLEKFHKSGAEKTKDSFTMIIVANLFAYKGHIDLIHALVSIKQELPKHWKLLCVGKDAGMENVLKTLTSDLQLSNHIQWLGECSDVVSLLSQADLGILCSHEEGFSNSILESMAMELPMVVTDVGGNAEAVLDGLNGLVVPPKNSTQLAQAILSLANDPARRQQMALASHERAVQCFSLKSCIHYYEMQYEKLLSEPSLTTSKVVEK